MKISSSLWNFAEEIFFIHFKLRQCEKEILYKNINSLFNKVKKKKVYNSDINFLIFDGYLLIDTTNYLLLEIKIKNSLIKL